MCFVHKKINDYPNVIYSKKTLGNVDCEITMCMSFSLGVLFCRKWLVCNLIKKYPTEWESSD